MKFFSFIIALLLISFTCSIAMPTLNFSGDALIVDSEQEEQADKVELFDLADIRITGGPFKKAIDYNLRYLLDLDPDRLLYGMRRGAGLKPKNDRHYGGWDNWGSTAAGGYLSGCALLYGATGDSRLLERVEYVVNEMAECQDGWGDGGLNVNDIEKRWFDKLRNGQLVHEKVVPWYQVQFIMAGLRDAWLHCGNKQALDVLVRLGDWCIDVTDKLSEKQWQMMLDCEFGGPHEYLADLYSFTGQEKYLELAKKFTHYKVFNPLKQGDKSVLYGLHANTQIPKFVGYQRIFEMDSSVAEMKRSAFNFYNRTIKSLSWANGANSQWECFFNENEFSIKVDDNCGPETCNTFNMLKLCRSYYLSKPDVSYIDYCENALYNHLLPALDPDQGGYVYYTSMKPGHYRVFSTPYDSFWCCVVTGMQNPGKYGEMIYAHDSNNLYVNMLLPSKLNWKDKGVSVEQITKFPVSNISALKFNMVNPREFKVFIRWPGWAQDGSVSVKVNGVSINVNAEPGEYISLERMWHNGDEIEVQMPMNIWTRNLPGNAGYKAVFYGPVLLSGKVDSSDLTDRDYTGGGLNDQAAYKDGLLADVPVLTGSDTKICDSFERISETSLRFAIDSISRPGPDEILPFYENHRNRYVVYWPVVSSDARYHKLREGYDKIDNRAGILKKAVDHIEMGMGTRIEHDHGLRGENLEHGGLPGMKWRVANNGGYLAYDMQVLPDSDSALVCRYWGSDGGARKFDIYVEGSKIAHESLTGNKPGEFIYGCYEIPFELTQNKTSVEVKFVAEKGNAVGGIFELWMIAGSCDGILF